MWVCLRVGERARVWVCVGGMEVDGGGGASFCTSLNVTKRRACPGFAWHQRWAPGPPSRWPSTPRGKRPDCNRWPSPASTGSVCAVRASCVLRDGSRLDSGVCFGGEVDGADAGEGARTTVQVGVRLRFGVVSIQTKETSPSSINKFSRPSLLFSNPPKKSPPGPSKLPYPPIQPADTEFEPKRDYDNCLPFSFWIFLYWCLSLFVCLCVWCFCCFF